MLAKKVSSSLGNSRLNNAKKTQEVNNGEKDFFCVYLSFFSACAVAYQSHRNLGLCTFITLAVALQFLAYSLLAVKVVRQKSVSGVSAKALQCYAVVYMSRLSSTTWLKGYIPTDSTGEWLYQAMDISSLLVVFFLLYNVHYRFKHTYQEDQDTFEISYLLCGCLILAVLLHPHLNARPVFDTLWTFALYVDVFAMMPQLWMVAKLEAGEEKQNLAALNAHFIAAIAVSRGVSLYFWFHGFVEFAPKNGGFNLTGWAIMVAHIIQVFLLLDFVFLYVKAWIRGSIRSVQAGGSCLNPDLSRDTLDI